MKLTDRVATHRPRRPAEPPPTDMDGARGARTTPEPLNPRRRRHPWRWLAAVLILVVLADLFVSLWSNPRVERHVVLDHLFSSETLSGVWVTGYLTLVSMVIGILGGTLLALMRQSGNTVLRSVALGYQWLFRGTPLLVQIIFWAYLGALYPQLSLTVPFTDRGVVLGTTSELVNITGAAILALGFNEAAYASEIIRAGILSVPAGQIEAAQALGMPRALFTRRIVLPQAMRVVIPPIGNETISMLKTTSLVSIVSGHDLMTNIENVYSQTFQVIPLLIVASMWYLALTSILSLGQIWLERHFGRGFTAAAPHGASGWRRAGTDGEENER